MPVITLYKRVFIILFTATSLTATAQPQHEHLQQLERSIRLGNTESLRTMAFYLDSTKKIISYLGYHRLETTLAHEAYRIINENCLFQSGAISGLLVSFLDSNSTKIYFDRDIEAYILTPIAQWPVDFKIKKIPEFKFRELKENTERLTAIVRDEAPAIEELVNTHNPRLFYAVATTLYKNRDRYNQYMFNEEDYAGFISLYTGLEILVRNSTANFTANLGEYDETPLLNYLIYWSKYYKNYIWDETQQLFIFVPDSINTQQPLLQPLQEEIWLEELASQNDSIVQNAFLQLSQANPLIMDSLSTGYYFTADIDRKLHSFAMRYLKQLPWVAQYCRDAGVEYMPNDSLLKILNYLKKYIPYAERYAIENRLVNTLSLDEVSMLEYWCIIADDDALGYSTARILDKIYSKKWDSLVNNPKHLKLYLKKAYRFERLGIIGTHNNYLLKFTGVSPTIIAKVDELAGSDTIIKHQAERIKTLKPKGKPEKPTMWQGNKNTRVWFFERKFKRIARLKDENRDSKIDKLVSKINYRQIGVAIKLLDKYKYKQTWDYSRFPETDFGFDVYLKDTVQKNEFLKNYYSLTEYELYYLYLKKTGLDFANADGTLNYAKVYDILKYDVVNCFVGCGGTEREDGVYLLIKLLELTFNTRLGYPKKLCASADVWHCSAKDQRLAWMDYLVRKKLVTPNPNEPVSFF